MVLQCKCGHPLPMLMDIGPMVAASKHTTSPINHTRPSPRKHSPCGTTSTEIADTRLLLTTHLSMGWWRWALVSPDDVAPIRIVCVFASINLPLHHKVHKFTSGTGSPGWSRKKGRKTVVVWWWYSFIDLERMKG